MALYFNGVNVKRVFMNGVEQKKLYHNGVLVWSSELTTSVNVTVAQMGPSPEFVNFFGYQEGYGGAVSPFQIDTIDGLRTIRLLGSTKPNVSTFNLDFNESTTPAGVEIFANGVWYNLINASGTKWTLQDGTLTSYFENNVGNVLNVQIKVKY